MPEIARRQGKLQSKLRSGSSGAATPQPAIAPSYEWQAVLIARPICVFRQLKILLGWLPAFAVLPHLLHLGGGLLHQREDVLRILLGAESTTRLAGMSGNQPLPVQRQDLLDELLRFERIDVNEAAPGKRSDWYRVDNEDNLLLRQPHYQVRIGMIKAEIFQFERSAAQLDCAAGVADDLIGERSIRILEHGKPLLGPPVRNDGGARVLERLAAGDVIIVMMAVDQELDRLIGHLLDLGDIVLAAGRPAVGDRISCDHPVLGDDKHRLMIAVAEYVDIVGAVNLGRLDLRPLCLLRQPRCCEPGGAQRDRYRCETNLRHERPPSCFLKQRRPVSVAAPSYGL